jgi:hypothetical protein
MALIGEINYVFGRFLTSFVALDFIVFEVLFFIMFYINIIVPGTSGCGLHVNYGFVTGVDIVLSDLR